MLFSGWEPFPVDPVLSSDLQPTGDREGLHLGTVLDRIAAAIGEKYPPSDPTARFVAGFVWETAVEYMHSGMTLDEAMDAAFRRYMIAVRKNVQTQVHLERDGIRATPDAFNPEAGEVESFKCVAPETLILTADLLWVPAGTLQKGQKLLGISQDPTDFGFRGSRMWGTTAITHQETVKRSRYKFEFEDGSVVISTKDHPWLLSGRKHKHVWIKSTWVSSSDLHVGDSVEKVVPSTWKIDSGWGSGYLAAAFDGEGCLHQNRYGRQSKQPQLQVAFSQNRNVMLDMVEDFLCSRGYEFNTQQVSDRHVRLQLSKKHEALRLLGSVRPLRLLSKFSPDLLGSIRPSTSVKVVSKESLGPSWVPAFETDLHTFVAEGFAAHNCSWRKMPATQEEFVEKFWRWEKQECSYAYLLGVDTARWVVLWNRGNYKDVQGPVVMQATAKWSSNELVDNWRMVLKHAEALRKEHL